MRWLWSSLVPGTAIAASIWLAFAAWNIMVAWRPPVAIFDLITAVLNLYSLGYQRRQRAGDQP